MVELDKYPCAVAVTKLFVPADKALDAMLEEADDGPGLSLLALRPEEALEPAPATVESVATVPVDAVPKIFTKDFDISTAVIVTEPADEASPRWTDLMPPPDATGITLIAIKKFPLR